MPILKLSAQFFRLLSQKSSVLPFTNNVLTNTALNVPSNARSIFMIALKPPANTQSMGKYGSIADSVESIVKDGGPDFSKTGKNNENWTTLGRAGFYVTSRVESATHNAKIAAKATRNAKKLSEPPPIAFIEVYISNDAQPTHKEVETQKVTQAFLRNLDKNPVNEVHVRDRIKDDPEKRPAQTMIAEFSRDDPNNTYYLVASDIDLSIAQPGQKFHGKPKVFAHDHNESPDGYRAVIYAEWDTEAKKETGKLIFVSAQQHLDNGRRNAKRIAEAMDKEGKGGKGAVIEFDLLPEQQQTKETSNLITIEKLPTITHIVTDFGEDTDDQLAIRNFVEAMNPGDRAFFTVGGPHPELAAAAIFELFEKLHPDFPRPVIALASAHDDGRMPEDKIFSLVSGRPMKEVIRERKPDELISRQELHKEISKAIKDTKMKKFSQIIMAPLMDRDGFYDPRNTPGDAMLQQAWKEKKPMLIAQFERDPASGGKGNNFQLSDKEARTQLLGSLDQYDVAIQAEGALSKEPEFIITLQQPALPGQEKANIAYLEAGQLAWLYFSGNNGEAPKPHETHVGMFAMKALIPFALHTSGQHPVGFGDKRGGKEICGIDDEKKLRRFLEEKNKILDERDDAILSKLQASRKDSPADVASMREQVHTAMMEVINEIAAELDVIKFEGKQLTIIKDLYTLYNEKNEQPLLPPGIVKNFRSKIVKKLPWLQDAEKIESGLDTNQLVDLMKRHGARSVVYDAVTVAIGTMVAGNSKLIEHFKEPDGVIYISKDKWRSLQEKDPQLFKVVQQKAVERITNAGTRMVVPPLEATLANDSSVTPTSSNKRKLR